MTIASPEAEMLAREVAKETGETPAQAVIRALEERLARLRRERDAAKTLQVIMEISRRCGALPDLARRPADEILGYDEAEREDGVSAGLEPRASTRGEKSRCGCTKPGDAPESSGSM